jgi:hypothetical protein
VSTDPEDTRPVYVVAATYREAKMYCRAVDAPRGWRIIIEAERLHDIGDHVRIIAVDTSAPFRPGMTIALTLTRVAVEWVSLDEVMGVDRDRGQTDQ